MRTIILDTRNQKDKFVEKALKERNFNVIRSKLPFGDVALSTDILRCIDLKSSGCGLIELAKNICSRDHSRLRNEIIECQRVGGEITFLCFEPNITCIDDIAKWKVPRFKANKWEDVYYLNGKRVRSIDLEPSVAYDVQRVMTHKKGELMTKVRPEVLMKAIKTMCEPNHYGNNSKVNFVFATKTNCGEIIENILTKD